MLFYYGHANKANPGPDITGGGQLAFAGALYFHLDPANGSVQLKLAGGAGSGTEILGQIVVDQLKTAGNGVITMALNSKKISNILKVAMLE